MQSLKDLFAELEETKEKLFHLKSDKIVKRKHSLQTRSTSDTVTQYIVKQETGDETS